MLDYISGDIFEKITHFKINSFGVSRDLFKDNAIIYCKTDIIPFLFNELIFSNRKYILITHNSDHLIDERLFKSRPPCIKKWFALNAEYNHPDLIPIPIGLNPEHVMPAKIKWFCENIEKFKNTLKDINTIYCNWNPENNPDYSTFRKSILSKLKTNEIKYVWDRKQLNETIGVFNKNLSFESYCENMAKYKFVISPPGHGLDCHRTWEALYEGCFPIVIKHNIYKEYGDLPIIQVKDYRYVTYELLHSYLQKSYSYEKLYMDYWIKRIANEFHNL